MPEGILGGVDKLIDQALQLHIGKAPHYRHKENCLKLSKAQWREFSGETLLQIIYSKIEANRDLSRPPSPENWRFVKQTYISGKNKSPEVKIERAIVNIPQEVWPDAANWVNQVPTSSGLVNESFDKRRAIDLVHRCDNGSSYEFIELKVDSDTPLYAAIEILSYGVLYMFSRENRDVLGYNEKQNQLLWAKTIHLIVLAPNAYYNGYELSLLEGKINSGLRSFLAERVPDLQMDFKFEQFSREKDLIQLLRVPVCSQPT